MRLLLKVVLLENANLTSQLALSSRLISFARYLKSQGDEVTIICANKDSYIRDRIKIIGNNCSTYTPLGNLKYILKTFIILKKLEDIDIIHVFQPNLSALTPIFMSRIKSKINCKVVNDIRSLWIEMGIAKIELSMKKGRILQFLLYSIESMLLNQVDLHIFITKDHKRHYEKITKKRFPNSIIIPNAIDYKNFNLEKRMGNFKRIIFGYIGSLQKLRGLEQIYSVFKKIKDIELHLYGSPEPSNLPENVKFFGYISYDEIPNVLRKFDVGLVHVKNSSNYWYTLITNMDGYPRKIIEYMGASLPILASNQKVNKTACRECALFYDPDNIADIKEKIRTFRDNEEMRIKMGKKGNDILKQNYSFEIVGKKLRSIYKFLINSKLGNET